jgi:hypothetical protein
MSCLKQNSHNYIFTLCTKSDWIFIHLHPALCNLYGLFYCDQDKHFFKTGINDNIVKIVFPRNIVARGLDGDVRKLNVSSNASWRNWVCRQLF